MRASIRRLFYNDTILGTGTISSAFAAELQRDLYNANAENGSERLDSIKDCVIKKGELDHMESPEDDIRQQNKIDRLADNFFSRIPLPKDPMAAALSPTKDEVVQNERFEILKESVRERYQAAQSSKRYEDSRIKAAMAKVDAGTWRSSLAAEEDEWAMPASKSPKVAPPAAPDVEKAKMQLEIEALKKRLAELEGKSGN